MAPRNPAPLLVDVALPLPVDRLFTYATPSDLAGRVGRGARVIVPFGPRRVTGYVLGTRNKAPGGIRIKAIYSLVDERPLLDEPLLELAHWMSGNYVHPIGEVLKAMLPGGVKGRGRVKDMEHGDFPSELESPELEPDQQEAFERVTAAMKEGRAESFLLHGVTGSGKTEVYLRCIEEALKAGRSALVLIPEIALIPQTTARFRRRFGDNVAVIHSRLTGAQRSTIWTQAAAGEIRVVIGARSAVFVPLRGLGMIVIDEEQDDSFKQEDKPHYDAVSVARFRIERAGGVLLLGSATPSIETYESARSGAVTYLKLRTRPGGGKMPKVEMIDMRGREGLISDELLGALETIRTRGEQAIVLINRRGHANYIQCRACGWIARCSNCSISLTFHSKKSELLCHYCGFRTSPPEHCPSCGAFRMIHRGIGTQRVEMELRNLLPGLRVVRMDLDTTSGKSGHLKILEQFSRGEQDVLLGTQMVAKGHHYPNVTLVGVLSADGGLNFPDFRAAERTFRLLSQAAGRTGRGVRDGKVIVQTFAPDHFLYERLAVHDYDGFAGHELELRRELRYPPFGELALFTVGASNEEAARRAGEHLARSLASTKGAETLEVLGPTEALVKRLKRQYRFQVLVKGELPKELRRSLVDGAKEDLSDLGKIDLRWDFDPGSFA
jgi:primosomal protein N' (replication factor Y)